MYALIVLKPFSLEVLHCRICETMAQVVEAAEEIEPNMDFAPLFDEVSGVETENYIFRLTVPEYAAVSV